MNWSKDRSITLSIICVYVFAAILLAADIFCFRLTGWFAVIRDMSRQQGVGMMVTVYVCSAFAWVTLYCLWRLLKNIRGGDVFIPENVRMMRIVSWCCAGAAVMCLVSILWYLPFVFVAVAAGFMCLIVRIVKNAFQQAIDMKDELDLTI